MPIVSMLRGLRGLNNRTAFSFTEVEISKQNLQSTGMEFSMKTLREFSSLVNCLRDTGHSSNVSNKAAKRNLQILCRRLNNGEDVEIHHYFL